MPLSRIWARVRLLAAAALLAMFTINCDSGSGGVVNPDPGSGCEGPGPGNTPPHWVSESYLPLPQAIAGTSASDVYAVGLYGGIIHFDGSAWSVVENPPSHQSLSDVFVAAPNRVFAVGELGTIVTFDGVAWQKMASGTTAYLDAVWGTSESDVFAVGRVGTILHFDGLVWTTMNSGTTREFVDVWGSSPSDVYAVGYDYVGGGAIHHYDGASWQESKTLLRYPKAVWGTSASDVFVVGTLGTIVHYDGVNWGQIPGTGSQQDLHAIWGSSSTDVYALESFAVIHYDGTHWTQLDINLNLTTDVWGTGPDDVWVLDFNGSVAHYNDTVWVVSPVYTRPSFRDVWTSAWDNVFVVGAAGVIYRRTTEDVYYPVWCPMASGTDVTLTGVWGSTPNDVFAVGDNGTIRHFDGASWSAHSSEVSFDLKAVWGASSTSVFAVGDGGTVLNYNGSDWAPMESGISTSLADVWGLSGQDVVVVGDGGAILHFDGVKWSPMKNASTADLHGVWGSTSQDMLAVGVGGTVLKFRPDQWYPLRSGTNTDFNDVWGLSPGEMILAGESTFRYDGRSFEAVYFSETLTGLYATSASNAFAVGAEGGIYMFVPGYP